jgi:hypothetical protein
MIDLLVAFIMNATPLQEFQGKCSTFNVTHRSAINGHPESKFYVACRWDYRKLGRQTGSKAVKRELRDKCYLMIRNPKNGKSARAMIADWGPHVRTGRTFDLSKPLLNHLGAVTDDYLEGTLYYSK